MTPRDWATLAGTLLLQALGLAYGYGKLTSDVGGLKTWVKSLSDGLKDHETRISRIEGAFHD